MTPTTGASSGRPRARGARAASSGGRALNSARGAPFQMSRTRSAGTCRSRTRKSRVEPLTAIARSVSRASTRSASPW